VLSSQQDVATTESILDKVSDSKDIRISMNWHIDCCISEVPLVRLAFN
jgi:hypothetical protein